MPEQLNGGAIAGHSSLLLNTHRLNSQLNVLCPGHVCLIGSAPGPLQVKKLRQSKEFSSGK
jgi:hypothetical protein